MRKFTGLLFSLLSIIAALVTLLNLWVLLILIFHAADLDRHAWGVVFGRLCVVTLFGFATFKAFGAGKIRLFGSVQNLMTMPADSSMQQTAIESNTVTRSTTLLTGYWIAFAVAAILAFFGAVLLIPAFQDLYPSFGADLPSLTLAVIKYRFALFVFPLIVLIPAVLVSIDRTIEKHTYTNYKISLAVFLVSLCVAFVSVAVALYLPIFRL
jgi:hypothetical protein